jgi:lactoylglutathione lyase
MQNHNVSGFFHYGLAVKNLDSVNSFFVDYLGLKLVAQREIRATYIEDLVNSTGVWAEVRMFEIEANSYLELLQWHGLNEEKESEQGSIISSGAQHLCIYVKDVDSMFSELSQLPNVDIISRKVTLVTDGPNTGAKILFVRVDNVLYIELFQKPAFRND